MNYVKEMAKGAFSTLGALFELAVVIIGTLILFIGLLYVFKVAAVSFGLEQFYGSIIIAGTIIITVAILAVLVDDWITRTR